MKWITVRLLPTLLLASAPSSARAFVHLWDINEIYSNANGSVQFIEMVVPAGANFENLFQGQTLRSTSQTFTFPNDVGTPTGGRSLLIATPGFAALPGAVAPVAAQTDFKNISTFTTNRCRRRVGRDTHRLDGSARLRRCGDDVRSGAMVLERRQLPNCDQASTSSSCKPFGKRAQLSMKVTTSAGDLASS